MGTNYRFYDSEYLSRFFSLALDAKTQKTDLVPFFVLQTGSLGLSFLELPDLLSNLELTP